MTYYHQAILSYIEIFKILHPQETLPTFVTEHIFPLQEDEMRPLEGSYHPIKDGFDFIYKIEIQENQLSLIYGENFEHTLVYLPKSPSHFSNHRTKSTLTFNSNEKGEITGMTYKQGKTEFNFEKETVEADDEENL